MALLLDAGEVIDLDRRNAGGATALLLAAQNGHGGCVRRLLERGADPTVPLKDGGATPLFLAAQEGHREVVELLLAAKRCVCPGHGGGWG